MSPPEADDSGLDLGSSLEGVKAPSVFAKSKSPLVKMGRALGGRRLKPAALESTSREPLCIIIMGDKDAGKTIASLTVPYEGRAVIVTFDNTTRMSLVNHFGPDILKRVEIYDMVTPVMDKDGTVVYPGYDQSRPETAEHVLGELALILDELEQDGNVGLLVIDHFQACYEQVARSLAHHKASVEPGGKLRLEDWQPRTFAMEDIEAKIRRVPRAGDEPKVIITGYSPEPKETYAKIRDPVTGKEKTVVVTETPSPKWLKDNIRRNWHTVLHLFTMNVDDSKGSTLGGMTQTIYMAQPLMSKTAVFKKGEKRVITDVGLEAFWKPSTTEELALIASAKPAAATVAATASASGSASVGLKKKTI